MSGFSSTWLALREPIDHAARSETVISALTHFFLNEEIVRITDIGSGTGSTIRALRPFMHNATWHLIDNDASLLNQARSHAQDQHVICTNADLSSDLTSLKTPKPDLITTSAFLDLVSLEWLASLVQMLKEQQLPFYAALSYDGHASTSLESPEEKLVIDAFNQHQKTDKGFGPALGPDAAITAVELFEEAGFLITLDQSDWQASTDDTEFMKMLLSGWKEAALEIAPDDSGAIGTWFEACMQAINQRVLKVRVGHKDFLAVPG